MFIMFIELRSRSNFSTMCVRPSVDRNLTLAASALLLEDSLSIQQPRKGSEASAWTILSRMFSLALMTLKNDASLIILFSSITDLFKVKRHQEKLLYMSGDFFHGEQSPTYGTPAGMNALNQRRILRYCDIWDCGWHQEADPSPVQGTYDFKQP